MSSRRLSLGVGDVVGERYRLVQELGEGGMSRVYEAVDLKYDRPAAVKVLARWLAEDEEFRERFEREASAAERATHPHVLPVWHVGSENGLLYLVTPLCDTDLAGLLKDQGPLEPSRAISIIARIAWALDWAHARGVVHRDVKPENILLLTSAGDDHAYLADFGLAKARVDATLTQAGHAAGFTPAYAPPEQWLGEDIGPAADQYALAGTLFTCLAGHPPFYPRRGAALREAHMEGPIPDLRQVVAGTEDSVAEAISRGLAKDAQERYGSCRELITATQTARLRDGRAGGSLVQVYNETEVGERDASSRPTDDVAARAVEAEPAPAEREREAAPQEPVVPEPVARDGAPGALAAQGPAEVEAHSERSGSVAVVEPAAPGGALVPRADAERDAPATPARRGSRTRLGVIVGLVAVVGAVAAALLLLPGRGGSGGAPTPPKGSAVKQIAVGPAPVDLAAGAGGVWVANSGADTVSRIAPRTGEVRQKSIPAVPTPFGVAVDRGHTWVVGPSGELAEIQPRTGRRLRTTNLNIQADGIAAGFDAVWIFNNTAGTVTRVDVSGGQIGTSRTVKVGSGTSDIAIGLGRVWVTNVVSSEIVELDPTTGSVRDRLALDGGVDGLAVGERSVWVTSPRQGQLLRINPATWELTRIDVAPPGREARAAVGEGAAFYINSDDGTAIRVDPATNRRAGDPVRVSSSPRAAIVTAGALWVTDVDRDTVARLPY